MLQVVETLGRLKDTRKTSRPERASQEWEEAGFGENMGSVCVELVENKADNPRWINDSGRREFQTRVELLQ